MNDQDEYIDGGKEEERAASDGVWSYSNPVTGMVTSPVHSIHSTSLVDYITGSNKPRNISSAITASVDSCRAANAALVSFASPSVNAFHTACTSPALATASSYYNNVCRTAASLAVSSAKASMIGMSSKTVAAQTMIYDGSGYGTAAMLDTHKTTRLVCKYPHEMVGCAIKPAIMFGGGYGTTGLLDSNNNISGSIFQDSYLSGIAAHSIGHYRGASVLEHIYSKHHVGYTNAQLVTTRAAMNTMLARSASGAIVVPKTMNFKWYGGGEIDLDHIYSEDYFKNNIGVIPLPHHDNAKSKWYGGGEAVTIGDNDSIVRSINNDYDHYVVNQKRDAYKSILDNFNYESVQLSDYSLIPYGTDWSAVVVDKISNYVSALDLYIATKDASLLHGISFQEWEAMAVGYSAGFANSLNLVYDRVNSKTARNKYASRRYNAIMLQKCKIIYKLDFRIIFRNIIRFLFKNMEDEPEGEYVSSQDRNNIFKPSKTTLYGNRENDFYFKYAA